jgi:hypothetical protein
MLARVSAHRHYRYAPVVTMRVGADNWCTSLGMTGAAAFPVGAVAGLALDAPLVRIHCSIDSCFQTIDRPVAPSSACTGRYRWQHRRWWRLAPNSWGHAVTSGNKRRVFAWRRLWRTEAIVPSGDSGAGWKLVNWVSAFSTVDSARPVHCQPC